MQKSQLRQLDLIFSSILIVFSAAVIIAALRMPWGSTTNTVRGGGWYLSPGLLPLLLASLIILFSANVLYHALRDGGHIGLWRAACRWVKNIRSNTRLYRVLAVIAVLSLYIVLMLGRINYYVASTMYLFIFISLFHRPQGVTKVRYMITLTAISVLVPLVTGYIFSEFLNVPLPG